jgi:hypothetical protein
MLGRDHDLIKERDRLCSFTEQSGGFGENALFPGAQDLAMDYTVGIPSDDVKKYAIGAMLPFPVFITCTAYRSNFSPTPYITGIMLYLTRIGGMKVNENIPIGELRLDQGWPVTFFAR